MNYTLTNTDLSPLSVIYVFVKQSDDIVIVSIPRPIHSTLN